MSVLISVLETMLVPSSCLYSSVYGRQTLQTGEEAFCDNGWTVNSSLNLSNYVLTNLIIRFFAEKFIFISLLIFTLFYINLSTHPTPTNLAEVTNETAVAQTSILVYCSYVMPVHSMAV